MDEEFIVLQDDIHDEGEDTAREAVKEGFEKYQDLQQVANYIKACFDKALGTGWNVVIGNNFGAHVSHVTNNYVFAQFRHLYITIWKS